ncbi:DUF6332 family protein [Streptomyces melanogenes]|uniref:DUF6332 family protein n=1 Tax=Streptomyces melanogenes TaxID=67326 RepID=A0ABZ1XEJ7_9ACTN|nr:DUF6332 family protein [Streptomyces melanogenes]
MSNRSQGERDAVTVEIMYAVVTASLVALLAFGAVAGPVFLFELSHPARGLLLLAGAAAAVLAFVGRTVHVLWRFSYAGGGGRRQPSQPGRTRPDS